MARLLTLPSPLKGIRSTDDDSLCRVAALFEYCEWNIPEFWKLHKELVELAVWLRGKDEINKQLVGCILGIQKSVRAVVVAHYNKNDVVTISGLTDEQLHEVIER